MHKLIKLEKNSDIKISSKICNYQEVDYIYLPVNEDIDLEFINKDDLLVKKEEGYVLSSISGSINAFSTKKINGKEVKTLIVENDFKESSPFNNIKNKEITLEKIFKILDKYNLNYLLNKLNKKNISNIIINSCNDDVYVHNEAFIFKNNFDNIIDFIDTLINLLKTTNNILVFKNNDREIIEKVLSKIGSYPNIKINLMDDLYLLEKDFFLLEKLNLKKENSLILKPSEILRLYNLVYYDKDLTEIYFTVSGNAVVNPKIIKTKLYASLKEIIDNNIKIKNGNLLFIKNGLMKGQIIDYDNEIITDDFESLIIINNDTLKEEKCIKCGKCYDICPVKINPICYINNKKAAKNCLDCGLCSYVCPSYINLRKYLKGDKNE